MDKSENYFKIKLNKQQQEAFENMQRFVKNPKEKVFLLTGYAGTGKTTLMRGLIKWLIVTTQKHQLLASTGRAAKVLSNTTHVLAKTVHSEIYVFKQLDEDLQKISDLQSDTTIDDKGQISLMFGLKVINNEKKKVYIIDEASMISNILSKTTSFAKFGSGELLQDLLDYDRNGKFIFVGDPIQLPPIGQIISPALSKNYFLNQFKIKAHEYQLTQIVRQSAVNGIISASMKIRKLHATNPKVKFANFPLKKHTNIVVHNSHISLINAYINQLKQKGSEYATLITQTNRHCSAINNNIRTTLGKTTNKLELGDLLLVTKNNHLTHLVNGDLVEVIQIGIAEKRCNMSFLKIEVKELVTKNVHAILMVEDILCSIVPNLNKKQHKDLLIDYYFRMKNQGIHQDDEAFKRNMLSDPYLNALIAVYGYALTCHKSQGGEWNEVFLYLDNKIHGIPKPSIYQWLYTAITRAKQTLHIIDDWFIK